MRAEIDSKNYSSWKQSARECKGLVFQALDLRSDDDFLAALPQAMTPEEHCVFLGCKFGPKLGSAALAHGAVIFPELPGRPYNAFRDSLYSVHELFAGYDPTVTNSYFGTPDWRSYASYIEVVDNKPVKPTRFVDVALDEVLARRLHDNFIEDELEEFLGPYRSGQGKGIVAIMGGHDRKRSDPVYAEIALLSRELAGDGFLIATGGGPGLMEAGNLGAYFAGHSAADLQAAIQAMANSKDADAYNEAGWLSAAWEVRSRYPSKFRSLGIPTWFYGHEPPNVFASNIAKYFENSLREEGLLAIATHGVIFAEGNAGTIQEIFQDACQNYYENYSFKSPMILYGKDYWHPKIVRVDGDYAVYEPTAYPAWPLLNGLAQKKKFQNLVTLTSDPTQVLSAVRAFQAPWQIASP